MVVVHLGGYRSWHGGSCVGCRWRSFLKKKVIGQDPENCSRPLPAMVPSRDPDGSRDIRTSPINRTRNKTLSEAR